MSIDEKLLSLPLTTKQFLLDQVSEAGAHPMGQSLARASKIYQLVYWTNQDKFIVYVGQTRLIGPKRDKITIIAIIMDWVTDKAGNTFQVMADKNGSTYLHETITCVEKKITYNT
jgi:hypothetical protein